MFNKCCSSGLRRYSAASLVLGLTLTCPSLQTLNPMGESAEVGHRHRVSNSESSVQNRNLATRLFD
ncbi:hypothetical protein AVEN_72710-1, partial [Araneus ventricosus]